jgi:diaminopimelate decarboxylase
MDHFNYRQQQLYAENVPVIEIAERFGTPCYIYSRATLERHWHAFDQALGDHPHKICYSVKANSNLAVLNILARLGSGFDIVSLGECERVLAAGGDPAKIVFSGVGKRADEMQRALELGIYCFNIESAAELALLNQVGQHLNKKAPISIRINPDVDAKTHPYIATGLKHNKFGIAAPEARRLYQQATRMRHIHIKGVDCHIGSQLTELSPFLEALDALLLFIDQLEADGIAIAHLDMGGGLGVRYANEIPPEPNQQAAALLRRLKPRPLEIIMEPGRAIAANAGILLTQVQAIKPGLDQHFVIVDAAMNDCIRPALYGAWQDIIPVVQAFDQAQTRYDIVGPVCESADFLGKNRHLSVQAGDYLAMRGAGAYGFVMSSNYNSRPRAAEVMVDNDKAYLVRRRETISELFASESCLPENGNMDG